MKQVICYLIQKFLVISDYEILEISSEDEGAAIPDDDEVTPLGLKRRRTAPKENNTFSPYLLGTGKIGIPDFHMQLYSLVIHLN